MFDYYPKCIFCFCELPKDRKGVGEHVYPKSIYGCWRIYDVCDNCMKFFGDEVDQLATKNPQIIKAMEKLGIGKPEKYYEQIPFVGEDTNDGRAIQMVYREGNLRTKTTKKEDKFIECPEKDWENIGVAWLRKAIGKKLSEEELNKEIDVLRESYKQLTPGEELYSAKLGYRTRKRQVKNPRIDSDTLPSISPLVAKIAYSFLIYVDPLMFEEDDILRRHARYGELLPEYTINWCSDADHSDKVDRFHRIVIYAGLLGTLLDVTFFGSITWRVVFKKSISYELKGFNNIKATHVALVIDFSDINSKTKWLGIQEENRKMEYRELII